MSSDRVRDRLRRAARVTTLVISLASVSRADARGELAGDDSRESVDSRAARASANAARRAVLVRDADAAVRLQEATRVVSALADEANDRVAIELHVLRSRILADTMAGESKAIARDLDRIVDQARSRGDNPSLAFALVYSAELAVAEGDRSRAERLIDRALRVPESDATAEAHIAAELLREHRLLGVGDADDAIRGLERARRTLARLRPMLDVSRFLALARPVHERLAQRLLDGERARVVDADAVDERKRAEPILREVLEVIEELRDAELRDYFGDPCLDELATTTPEKLDGTFLLYPIALEDRVELIFGESGHLARRTLEITPAALESEVRRLRGALQDPTGPRYRAVSSRLFDVLIRPVADQIGLEGNGAKDASGGAAEAPTPSARTLVVVPSGALRTIPMAALYDERRSRFLVEDVALAMLSSLRVRPPESIDFRRTRLLAAGLTEPADGFPALPSAARELAAAAHRFPTTRRLDSEFTRASLAADLESAPWDVVHLASHGRFDAHASESFLVAHDGRIGLADLARLLERTGHRTGRPLELLVLSACETAIGDDRAVLGMAGVALKSGARSAVASLWKVHDEATTRLFEVFYAQLGIPGVTRAEALRRAQRALLADPRYRHPVYWSAFQLIDGWL